MYWTKVPLINQLMLPPYSFDVVFWIDSDAIFYNMSRSLLDIMSSFGIVTHNDSHHSDHHDSHHNQHHNIKQLHRHNCNNYHHSGDCFKFHEKSPDVISSGDGNIFNSGVVLYRNSNWTKYFLSEVYAMGELADANQYKKIGMGYDNAMMSAFLAGCTLLNTSREELVSCYNRSDGRTPSSSSVSAQRLIDADISAYRELVPADILLTHYLPVPQRQWQSYYKYYKYHRVKGAAANAGIDKDTEFVLHFPGLTQAQRKPVMLSALEDVENIVSK
jgi:hypothetical protein